jgi:hypothetical protein
MAQQLILVLLEGAKEFRVLKENKENKEFKVFKEFRVL